MGSERLVKEPHSIHHAYITSGADRTQDAARKYMKRQSAWTKVSSRKYRRCTKMHRVYIEKCEKSINVTGAKSETSN